MEQLKKGALKELRGHKGDFPMFIKKEEYLPFLEKYIDQSHRSGRDSMRIECVEVARSYKPKLKDKGVEVSDGGIFVDYNEAIASALKKIKL